MHINSIMQLHAVLKVLVILNIQHHYHKMTMLKVLKWPSKQLYVTTCMGPLHARNNWTMGSHWPIKNMVKCHMRLSCEPVGRYNILLAGGIFG
jgi:hypothetical protein